MVQPRPRPACRLSWPLAVALLVSAPLLTPLIAQLSRRIGAASKASQAASNDVSAAADEVVENMRVVKLFAQQTRELRRFQGLLDAAHAMAVKVGAQGPAVTGSIRPKLPGSGAHSGGQPG